MQLPYSLSTETLAYSVHHRRLLISTSPLLSSQGRAGARLRIGYDSIAPRLSEIEGPSLARLQPRLRYKFREPARLRERAESRTEPATSPESIHLRPPEANALGGAARVSAR